jgi:hypothetical protein
MTRDTSREAYAKNVASGYITGIRLKVYRELYARPDSTAGEIADAPALRAHQVDSVRPRFAELETAGLIQVTGKRECRVTGMTVVTWSITDKIAEPFKRPEARTFWIIKRPGHVGKAYGNEEQAERIFTTAESDAEFIEVREKVSKAQVVKREQPDKA